MFSLLHVRLLRAVIKINQSINQSTLVHLKLNARIDLLAACGPHPYNVDG